MELNYFKDKMFELLNDADNMAIRDIEVNDRKNQFRVELADGSVFALECSQLKSSPKMNVGIGRMRICWMMGGDKR